MESWQSRLFSIGGLAALAVIFIALVMLSNALLRGARLDLTENKLYTVSDGTREVLSAIDEPVTLYLYYSEQAARSLPALRTYANRVQELLDEFSQRAGGQLRVVTLDPRPFSEEEDQAAQFGLQPLSTPAGDSVYFGLAGTNAVGDEEVIPFLDPGKEPFLEYDLARMVYTLATPEKPVVGVMTTLPMGGDFNMQTRQPTPAWVIDEQIGTLFTVRDLSPAVTEIDAEIDVLMLVHPKNLSQETLYAIDQFILRGGRAMIFVDPHSEVDQPPNDPANPGAALMASRSSELETLFAAWGVSVSSEQVLGDNRYALQVANRPGAPPTRHLALLGIDADGMDDDDIVTADLDSINLGVPGYIEVAADAPVTVTPLLVSSEEAGTIPSAIFRFLRDPATLRDSFTAVEGTRIIAARLSGEVASAFADGAPGDGDTEGHVASAVEPIKVVVVADTDILADHFWVTVQNFFGQRILTPWADNGDFVIGALDNLTGSDGLIGIRSRATFRRPFDRVETLRRQAEQRFAATEQQLQDQLLATESKLGELQAGRSDDNIAIMTDEQRAEIERFIQQRTEVRKELRRVRRDLDKDIEQLGVTLKVLNIALVPGLIAIGALAWVVVRSQRRRRQREAA
ncbi:MAG: Gldg family protein [Gammaproteobacteria bacterium]|nr:Gldg family protein [Gammaproteobacteria bacterium]